MSATDGAPETSKLSRKKLVLIVIVIVTLIALAYSMVRLGAPQLGVPIIALISVIVNLIKELEGKKRTKPLGFLRLLQRLWQQSRNVPFWQSRNVPSISERSRPFPLATIVLLAAEPVKASLRRAQRRRAALTEPAASRNPFFLTRGNGISWKPQQGDVSTLLQRGTFLLCRDKLAKTLDRMVIYVYACRNYEDSERRRDRN